MAKQVHVDIALKAVSTILVAVPSSAVAIFSPFVFILVLRLGFISILLHVFHTYTYVQHNIKVVKICS